MKKGKQSKREAPHTAEAMAAGKELMVVALGKGMGPGDAAEAVGVGRSTAYTWKKDDAAFSAKWDEAVQTALDKLEGRLNTLGMDGDRQSIHGHIEGATS